MDLLRRNPWQEHLKKLEEAVNSGDETAIPDLVRLQLRHQQVPKLQHLSSYLANLEHQISLLEDEAEENMEKSLNSIFISLQNEIQELSQKFDITRFLLVIYADQDADDDELEERHHRFEKFKGNALDDDDLSFLQFWRAQIKFGNQKIASINVTTPSKQDKNLVDRIKSLLWTLNRVGLIEIIAYFFNLQSIDGSDLLDSDDEIDEDEMDLEETNEEIVEQLSPQDLRHPLPIALDLTPDRIRLRYQSGTILSFSYQELTQLVIDSAE